MKRDEYILKDCKGKTIERFLGDDWYDRIEEPVRDLVKLLRDNGYNTTCSCGYGPTPSVQMEWYLFNDIAKLYMLLDEQRYYNFQIEVRWISFSQEAVLSSYMSRYSAEINFFTNVKSGSLVKIEDIKKVQIS